MLLRCKFPSRSWKRISNDVDLDRAVHFISGDVNAAEDDPSQMRRAEARKDGWDKLSMFEPYVTGVGPCSDVVQPREIVGIL